VSGVRWLDEDEMRAWRRLMQVRSQLMGALDREMQAAHGMSMADYEVLIHVSEAGEQGLRMTELAEALLLSPSGLTRRLDGLVRDGLVTRRSCPSDRRGSYAVLTEAGWRRLQEAAPTHVDGVRRHFIDRLTPKQLQAMADALGVVVSDDGGNCGMPEEASTSRSSR
jgi:DNA-binding MarR family transcriptional regulator